MPFSRTIGFLLCVLFLNCLPTDLLTGADWPRFRGDGSAAAPDEHTPLKWSGQENLLWKSEITGHGSSSPVVFRGRVYLTSFTGYGLDEDEPGEKQSLSLHVQCFDRSNGSLLWDKSMAASPNEQALSRRVADHGYATGTVAVDESGVYAYFGVSGVVAYSLDGELKWKAESGDRTVGFGSASSPILFGDLVIVNASIEADAVLAIDKETGKERWRIEQILRSWTTPLVAPDADGKDELIVSQKEIVAGYDPQSGKPRWTCRGIQDYVVPCVVAHQGVAYVLGGRKNQSMAIRLGGEGDVTETHKLWENSIGANVTSPVYHQGRLYWASDRGVACCLNAEDGKEVYRERLKTKSRIYASVVLANNRLYVTTRDAGVIVLALGDVYKELAVNTLEEDESLFNASPAVSDGHLFLRTNRFLYCIGEQQ